jgi:hypothetical protein
VDKARERLARCYGDALEQFSQCARAMRDGEWAYLADLSGHLEQAARDLAAAAAGAGRDQIPASAADDVLTLTIRDHTSEVALALHPPRSVPAATRTGFHTLPVQPRSAPAGEAEIASEQA